jgi:hypothetical protein
MRTLHQRPPEEAIRTGDYGESNSVNVSRLYFPPAGYVLHITHAWASVAQCGGVANGNTPLRAQASVIAAGSPQVVIVRATTRLVTVPNTSTTQNSDNAVSLSDLDVIEPDTVLSSMGSTPPNLPFYAAAGWSGYLMPVTAENGGY